MIAAVMQPYFFPYIGYYQLMHAVDTFVFHDDVQYITQGWVNRNKIPYNGKSIWLTMPVAKANHTLPINQRNYLLDIGIPAINNKIINVYHQTSRPESKDIIHKALHFSNTNVASYNMNLLKISAEALGIGAEFLVASDVIKGAEHLRGESRVIEICRRIGATHYVNPIGGVKLYTPAHFLDSGIKLSFLKTTSMPTQVANEPMYFSIIDPILKLGIPASRSKLREYDLIEF